MEIQAYQELQDAEESWWYRSRKLFVQRLLSGMPLSAGRSLDFGAGFGGMRELVGTYGVPDALEINPVAANACRDRGYAKVMASVGELEKESYQFVGAFDVIEHIQDDTAAIQTLRDCLSPGGVLAATVPAFSFLWSRHDELNHHFRRYTLPEIVRLFREAGFVDVRATYWNMTLFPVAFALRLVGRGGGGALMPARPINWLLARVLQFESLAVPGVILPFGTSIAVVARKKGGSMPVQPLEKSVSLWSKLAHPVSLFSLSYHYRLLHFLGVGSMGALLNLFLTWLFTEFVFGQERYLDAFVIGIIGNLIFNFVSNTIITFRTQRRHLRRFFAFVTYSLFMAWVQYLTVRAIMPFLKDELYLVAIALVIGSYALVNFVVFRNFIFRESPPQTLV